MIPVKKEKKQFNIYRLVSVFSIILSVVLIFERKDPQYEIFCYLPAVYGLFSILFQFNLKINNGIAYNIISVIMIIRYDITVAITVLSDNYSGYNVSDNHSLTFWLMVYEMLVVFIVMNRLITKQQVYEYEVFDFEKQQNNRIAKVFFIFVIAMTLFVSITNSNTRATLFNLSFITAKEDFVLSDDALTGPEFVFFKIGINVIYAVVITAILKWTKRRTATKFLFCAIASILFVSCNWTNGAGISRWGLVTSFFVSFIVLYKAFPKYRKMLLVVGLSAFALVIISSSVAKVIEHHAQNEQEALSDIFSAEYLNEYFQGFFPVGNGLKIMQYHKSSINFTTFLDDTISAYPWLNKLFYQEGNLTAIMYETYLGSRDKIISTVVQGYAHFGIVGAPIFSGLCTYIAFMCERVIKKSKNIPLTVALVQIMTWCSLFMAVNIYIIQRTTMYFVLFLLVYAIDKKIKVK